MEREALNSFVMNKLNKRKALEQRERIFFLLFNRTIVAWLLKGAVLETMFTELD